MDTRRLLIAALLSLAVLVLWQWVFPPPERPVPEERPVEVAERLEPAPEAERPRPAEPEPAIEAPEPVAEREERPSVEDEVERRVVLETDDVRAEFTNRGAQLVSFRLKEVHDGQGGPLDLVRQRDEPPFPFGLVRPDGEPHPLNDALFVVRRGTEAVELEYQGPRGAATKRFALRADGQLDVDFRVRDGDWGLLLGPGIRNPTAEELGSRFQRRSALYYTAAGLERLAPERLEEATSLPGAGLRWVGLDDTYFLVALTPQTRLREVRIEPVLEERIAAEGPSHFTPLPPSGELSAAQRELPRELRLVVEPATDDARFTAYWGAKEYRHLAGLESDLERSVRWGFLGLVVRPLYYVLLWIHDRVVPNYGWALILMTVLIKLVLLPLEHKSYKSMLKMQKLKPQMDALRAKYRGKLKDKSGRPDFEAQRKMNEEMMALYKSSGVNPASGCLPMLPQMPILFAFFFLLSTAAELRHAPWILWIEDLSARDPYYILPVVMGASMFYQMRMTPMSGDPLQRRIFQFMPIVFTFFFFGFPSGLVLYWLTNNVLTILRQAVFLRYFADSVELPGRGARKGAKKGEAEQGGKKSR